MNKYQKEIINSRLKDEKQLLKELKSMYKEALNDVNKKIEKLMKQPKLQSKIYQSNYQKTIKKQLEAILNNIDDYTTIDEFINNSYQKGFISSMYDIARQGIPIIRPIDQKKVVQAIVKETKLSDSLYEVLGYNKKELADKINKEISRGIATASSYSDIARNVNDKTMIGMKKSYTIARTEGHRVYETAQYDAVLDAKDIGCDIVKQWCSVLDDRTRTTHAELDGEIVDIDEPFSNGLMYPGDPSGSAEETINCRCTCSQRAKWGLDKKELDTLRERASFYGIDKSKSLKDFENKYLNGITD